MFGPARSFVVLLLFSLPLSAQFCTDPPDQHGPVGRPILTRTADFDGDGTPDVLVAGTSDGLSIYRSDPLGKLGLPQPITVPSSRDIEVLDFDGDLDIDILVATSDPRGVALLLNDGTAEFALFTIECDSCTGLGPLGITAGDFDADGALEIAATYTDLVRIYDFAPGTGITLTSEFALIEALDPAAADFDADGFTDLAVATWSNAGSSIQVYLGSPTGFVTGALLAVGGRELIATDLDNDGLLDLAANNRTEIVTYLTQGAASFSPAMISSPTTPGLVSGMAVSDLNLDGFIDVAAASPVAEGVEIWIGGPGGSLSSTPTTLVGERVFGVTAADLTGDGIPELIASATADLVVLGRSSVSDDFLPVSRTTLLGYPSGSATGDFDANGTIDAIVLYRGPISVLPETKGIGVFRGDGTGGFDRIETFPIIPDASVSADLELADFDADGDLDLLIPTLAGVYRMRNDGNLQFSEPPVLPFIPSDRADTVAVGDLDGNGFDDFVVGPSYEGFATVVLHGAQIQVTTIDIGVPAFGVAIVDVDQDGAADLVFPPVEGQLITLPGLGNGTFGAAVTRQVSNSPFDVTTGDFNGDGFPDLALSALAYGDSSTYSVLFGDGTFTFGTEVEYPLPPATYVLEFEVDDLNNDGALDLLALATTGPELEHSAIILQGNGLGGFIEASSFPVNRMSELKSTDLDLDGVPELTTLSLSENTLSVRRLSPCGGPYLRGDCSGDQTVDIADGIAILGLLFGGATVPTCDEACDFDDDGSLLIADAIQSFSFLFSSGPPPALPYPQCGELSGGAVCGSFAGCP